MRAMIDLAELDSSAMWHVSPHMLDRLYKKSNVALPFNGDERPGRKRTLLNSFPPPPRQHCNLCGITHDA